MGGSESVNAGDRASVREGKDGTISGVSKPFSDPSSRRRAAREDTSSKLQVGVVAAKLLESGEGEKLWPSLNVRASIDEMSLVMGEKVDIITLRGEGGKRYVGEEREVLLFGPLPRKNLYC